MSPRESGTGRATLPQPPAGPAEPCLSLRLALSRLSPLPPGEVSTQESWLSSRGLPWVRPGCPDSRSCWGYARTASSLRGGPAVQSLSAVSTHSKTLPPSSRRAAWETRRDKAMVCPAPPPDLGKWPEAGPMARSPILSLELQSLGTRPPKPGTTPLQTRRQT